MNPQDRIDMLEMTSRLSLKAIENFNNEKFSDYNQNIFTIKKGIDLICDELISQVVNKNERR